METIGYNQKRPKRPKTGTQCISDPSMELEMLSLPFCILMTQPFFQLLGFARVNIFFTTLDVRNLTLFQTLFIISKIIPQRNIIFYKVSYYCVVGPKPSSLTTALQNNPL